MQVIISILLVFQGKWRNIAYHGADGARGRIIAWRRIFWRLTWCMEQNHKNVPKSNHNPFETSPIMKLIFLLRIIWGQSKFGDTVEITVASRGLTLNPTAPKVYWFPMGCAPLCPHFSDSSTRWPTSEQLFHHTDFIWTDRTFFVAVSFTDMLGKF